MCFWRVWCGQREAMNSGLLLNVGFSWLSILAPAWVCTRRLPVARKGVLQQVAFCFPYGFGLSRSLHAATVSLAGSGVSRYLSSLQLVSESRRALLCFGKQPSAPQTGLTPAPRCCPVVSVLVGQPVSSPRIFFPLSGSRVMLC